VLEESGADVEALARLAGELEALEGPRRAAGLELIRSLERILKR
jgi:hypothetical protein